MTVKVGVIRRYSPGGGMTGVNEPPVCDLAQKQRGSARDYFARTVKLETNGSVYTVRGRKRETDQRALAVKWAQRLLGAVKGGFEEVRGDSQSLIDKKSCIERSYASLFVGMEEIQYNGDHEPFKDSFEEFQMRVGSALSSGDLDGYWIALCALDEFLLNSSIDRPDPSVNHDSSGAPNDSDLDFLVESPHLSEGGSEEIKSLEDHLESRCDVNVLLNEFGCAAGMSSGLLPSESVQTKVGKKGDGVLDEIQSRKNSQCNIGKQVGNLGEADTRCLEAEIFGLNKRRIAEEAAIKDERLDSLVKQHEFRLKNHSVRIKPSLSREELIGDIKSELKSLQKQVSAGKGLVFQGSQLDVLAKIVIVFDRWMELTGKGEESESKERKALFVEESLKLINDGKAGEFLILGKKLVDWMSGNSGYHSKNSSKMERRLGGKKNLPERAVIANHEKLCADYMNPQKMVLPANSRAVGDVAKHSREWASFVEREIEQGNPSPQLLQNISFRFYNACVVMRHDTDNKHIDRQLSQAEKYFQGCMSSFEKYSNGKRPSEKDVTEFSKQCSKQADKFSEFVSDHKVSPKT